MKRQDGDRDIVFSAKQYRYTGLYYHEGGKLTRHGEPNQQTLEETGLFHLYRINPDGTGMTRLTHDSTTNDIQPHWSPDGRSLLYLRDPHTSQNNTRNRKEVESVCRMDPDGRRRQTLFTLPNQGIDTIKECFWSPDGKLVAVIALIGKGWITPEACLILIDSTTGHPLRKIYRTYSAVWDSTGRYLAIADWYDQSPRILDLQTGTIPPFRGSGGTLRNLGFLTTTKQFIGDMSYRSNTNNGRSQLLTPGNGSGDVVLGQQIKWSIVNAYTKDKEDEGGKEGNSYAADWFPDEGRRWFGLTALGKNALLAEASHARSDGGERNVFRADLKSGNVWLLHCGYLIAVSPDGRRCAVATDDWVGPYKRGGRRCGPLEILSTTLPMGRKARKGHPITPALMSFAGGDWR